MKKGDWEDMPESWHCINVAGSIVQVDTETRKEIECWLKTLEYPKDRLAFIIVTSVLGEEVTIMADAVNLFYSTTPEERFKSRCHDDLMAEERRSQGFPEQ